MKKLMIALAGMALVVSTSMAMAGNASSPAGSGVVKPQVIKFKDSIIQYGSGGASLTGGSFTAIDSAETFTCGSSCTLTVSAMVQLEAGSGNNWAICAEVDGTLINPACPYQGNTADTGSYVTGNSQQNYTVSAGSHTVQTTVYVSSTTTLANWQTTQSLYKNAK